MAGSLVLEQGRALANCMRNPYGPTAEYTEFPSPTPSSINLTQARRKVQLSARGEA